MTDAAAPGAAMEMRMIRLALQKRGRARLAVSGPSMLPALRDGEMITIVDQPFETVEQGQVIAFGCDGKIIVHRVVRRNRGHLVTLGDNMLLLDPPLSPDMYLGAVHGVAPPRNDRELLPPAWSAMARDQQLPRVEVVLPSAASPSGTGPSAAGAGLLPGVIVSSLPGDPDALRVGISPAGALGRWALPRLLRAPAPARLTFLIGFTFGRSGTDGPDPAVLPPSAAAVHLRLGEPLQEVPVDRVLQILSGHLARAADHTLTGAPR